MCLLCGNEIFKPRAYFFVGKKLASTGAGQALLNFADEPLVVINEACNGFLNKRLRIATLLGGKASELGFGGGVEMYFHRP